jgi:UDP-N-acetylglucosamine 2-epimerase
VGEPVDLSDGYLVVLQHPVTTEYDGATEQVLETLYAIRSVGIATLWFWPNVDAGSDGTSRGIRMFRELEKPVNIHFFKNMLPLDFLRILCNSRGIVGNSSVGVRECAFLGVPAVNIGSRQAGRERGRNVVDVHYNRAEIQGAIQTLLRNGAPGSDPIYGEGSAGQRIADLLATVPLNIEKRLMY